MATQYDQLLNAVASYYGRGSDEWVSIAQYGLTADNCATILKQTPNVSTILSKDGSRVLSYSVSDTATLATQGAGAVVNSNTQTALMTKTATLQVPAEMTLDSTETVLAESGMKTVSTGAKVTSVLGKVATGVAAVGAGVQLGATIDSALYNANPDFWDSHNMSTLNPQSWDSLVSSENGKDIFNMVFGIDKDTGETQGYLDEKSFAYIAQYLMAQGAFSSGDYEVDTTYKTELSSPYNTYTYDIAGVGVNGAKYISATGTVVNALYRNNTSDVYFFYLFSNSAQVELCACSLGVFQYTNDTNYPNFYTATQTTINGQTYYYSLTTMSYTYGGGRSFIPDSSHVYDSGGTEIYNAPAIARVLGYLILYHGSMTTPIDGIKPQTGATVPSGITSDMTIDEVIAQLRALYPDLFNDAITNDVVQEDGTVDTITYLPIAIPDNIGVNESTGELEPTGGIDLSQDNTVISDESTANLIQSLLDMLTTPNPYDPTPTDTDTTPDYPDTGEGDTPSIVTPLGSANALYSIYNPSQTQLNNFGTWLWSSNFVDQLLKIFNDPMQAIIGLHKIFATPSVSGTGTIKVGYLDSNVGTNIVSNQYTSIDCGTVDLYEYFGNALDYLNTDIYCYLPFVGVVRLNTDDVMRASINITYKVDVLTGACLCSISVYRDLAGGQLYTYSGNCAVQYPLSSGSYMGIVSSVLGVAGSVVGTIASGGALLPMALGVGASAVTGAKTRVDHSGSISGNSGAMGIKKPYLIIRRPQTAIADKYPSFMGVANNEYITLIDCSGYTQIEEINLENIRNATGEEMTEIENLLKSGVII